MPWQWRELWAYLQMRSEPWRTVLCLARDVIVSEAQAADHNRSIVNARNALYALRRQISGEHDEVCRHLRDAQMAFLQTKPLINLATGYTGCDTDIGRDLNLSALIYEPNEGKCPFGGC